MDYTELIENLRAHCTPNCNHGRCTLLSAADCSEILARQAADAIEELQAAQKWIPVTERLPEDNLAVLVTYIGHNSHKPQADLLAYRYDGEWLWVEDATSFAPLGDTECAVPITHWMPLPAPPKEGTE